MNQKGSPASKLKEWLNEPGQKVERSIDYIVQNNPRGAYQWIQHNFKGEYRELALGMEKNEAVMEEMMAFIKRKAYKVPNPEKFIDSIIPQIGVDYNADNWTKPL